MSDPTAVASDNNAGPQLVIWGTDVEVTKCQSKFKHFIQEYTDLNIETDELMENVDFERPFYMQKLEECIASVLSVFSSIVREFLELFYNLWRTVLAKNKIVLDPALRLQSFRTLKMQQLVSEVGLNANNKSDGGPVPDSSRKIV
ncbi:DNA helicase [Trichonephila clavipes]|nr:DNA helicase [Trichonephila clavipes]